MHSAPDGMNPPIHSSYIEYVIQSSTVKLKLWLVWTYCDELQADVWMFNGI